MNESISTSRVEEFIACARALSPRMEHVCLHGGCYRFHLLLTRAFPEGEPYMNAERDHVVTRIGDGLYDITGRIASAHGKTAASYHRMTPGEEAVAAKWKSR